MVNSVTDGTADDASVTYHKRTVYYQRRTGSEYVSGAACHDTVPEGGAWITSFPNFVMGYVYGALVESFCSEQNARMMAMEAANKNASAMIHDLSIQYNRVRQATITQEITEVIAGAKAQKKKKKARKEVLSN